MKPNIVNSIRAAIGVSKSNRLREKYEDAVNHLHRLEADRVFLDKMRSFYDEKANSIDPEQDWWGYAAAKEEWKGYVNEIKIVDDKLETQRACVEARCAALKAHNDVC